MKGKNPGPRRIGEELEKKLLVIKEQLEQEGIKKPSWVDAGNCLSKRIDNAGGLLER